MTAAEMPEWRRPFGAVTAGVPERERMSLRDAVLDTIGGAVLSAARITQLIHEEWGGCSDELLDSVLVELVDDGELRQLHGDRYTRGGEASP